MGLLTHLGWDWKDFNGECLLRAVDENNKTAVDFICRKTFPLPDIDARNEALKKAKQRKGEYETNWETDEMITAGHIIETLKVMSNPHPNQLPAQVESDYMVF